MMSPHLILGGLFILTSNSHWLPIPLLTAGIQWMYLNRHFSNMTLYYDMYSFGNNPNHIATYNKIREILLTNPEFQFYIDQPSQGTESKNLIIENPKFQPFSFTESGMIGKIDEKRTRFSFDCSFKDLTKNSNGRVHSLIVFNDRNEAYFEVFTVFIDQPMEKTIRIQESEFTEGFHDLSKFNRPTKGYVEEKPKEKPKSNFRQY